MCGPWPAAASTASSPKGAAADQFVKLQALNQELREAKKNPEDAKRIGADGAPITETIFGPEGATREQAAALADVTTKTEALVAAFSAGKIGPAELFKGLEEVRNQLQGAGADAKAVNEYLVNMGNAASSIGKLTAEIVTLRQEMQALAKVRREIVLPGGSFRKTVPPAGGDLPA